ncbi:MAG: hypothetical protein H6709_08970 [Kofleriaceae bacterium]|nr:hypothetical protein [Kofleriaceae bacterium]MCB9572202.1 hypothetical protein [Kofleriaceae bacterium]
MTTTLPVMTTSNTWHRDRGLARWAFASTSRSAHASEGLIAHVVAVASCVAPFADIASVSWSTGAKGEDSLVRSFESVPSEAAIIEGAGALDDITGATLELDLRCISSDGALRRVEDGASLEIERTSDGTVVTTFVLNVDLFVPLTWGTVRQNGELASTNAPRLNAFLERLSAASGGVLSYFDTDEYTGQLTEIGVAGAV